MEVRHRFPGILRSAASATRPSTGLLTARPMRQLPVPAYVLRSTALRYQSSADAENPSAPPPVPSAAAAAKADATPSQASPSQQARSPTPSWLLPTRSGQNKTRSRLITPLLSREATIGGRTEGSILDRLGLPRAGTGGNNPTNSSSPSSLGSTMLDRISQNSSGFFSVGHFLGPIEEEERRRLAPSLGREVPVTPTVDPARAFALLNMAVVRNRIPSDVRKQRFHERPGLKRKRLKSERWRARFKHGFKHTVSRVRELAKQGW